MIALARILSAAIVIAAGVRAAAALLLFVCDFPKRAAVYFIEPQMVHFARCAQRGESLYPEWKNFPYIADIYTPGYFWVVGMISRAARADLDGVMRIGRATTILFSLLGAAAVGWVVRSKGLSAMAAAFGFSIGSVLMMGFGGMVRPDVAADVLGFIGFLTASAASSVLASGLILAAAVLCKQSAVIYVLAAAVALIWMGRARRALLVSVVASTAVFAALTAIWLLGERNVVQSVLLEAGSPWRWEQWSTITIKFLARSGDVVLLCAAGAVHWRLALRRRDDQEVDDAKRWSSLLVVGGGFALLGVAKVGSDLNYFLPLRYLGAVALAEMIARFRAAPRRPGMLAGMLLLFALVLWTLPWWNVLRTHDAFDPAGKRMARIYQSEIDAIGRMGESHRVFTNCDDAALRAGNPFLDAYAFRLMVDDGRLQPTVLADKLRNGEYDRVVTTGPLEDPGYRDSAFALPLELTNVILQRYEKFAQAALVYYRPKK